MPEPASRPTLGTVRLALSLVWSAGRGLLLLIITSTIVTSVAIAGQLLVGGELLDLVADDAGADAGDLAGRLVALGLLMAVSSLSQTATNELRIPLGEQVHRRAIEDILDVATEVEVEAYESSGFHDRLARAQEAAGAQSSSVVFGLITMLSTVVVTVGVVAVLITVVPALVPVAVLGYLPVAYVSIRNNRARYRMERELTELTRERNYLEYLLTERVEAKEIRAYGTAPVLRRWHGAIWDERLARLTTLIRRRLALTSIGTLFTTVVLVGTLSFTLVLAGRGTITIGDAAAAIVGLQALSGRLQAAANAFTGVHNGVTFLRDFEDFRAALPELRRRTPTAVPPTPPLVLSVEHLGYRYPGAEDDALRSVSFELRRGQSMAIVGANGAGKSTLSNLLCHLLTPTRGTIRWDGVRLDECDPVLVRAQIAPVFQDFAQYVLSIRQVIGLGDVEHLDDDERLLEAAKRAGVERLATTSGAGLDTRLGKAYSGGIDVSLGQWQRLAIARALFRDAPLVVLDEPSASLDPRAEAELFDLLQELCGDRIVIFVSHRFSTVRSADVVMVLDNGDVVEMGSHDHLIAAGGLYYDLFSIQAGRFGLEAKP